MSVGRGLILLFCIIFDKKGKFRKEKQVNKNLDLNTHNEKCAKPSPTNKNQETFEIVVCFQVTLTNT